MAELVPRYPQPYRLYNPWTGHPLFSGPNGQPGYATPQPQANSWVQPDGVEVWFYDTSTPDPNNRVALGLNITSPNDPGIGYQGAYDAAVRHGANPQQADLFAAISMAESSAHWSDHNNNSATGDDSIGLWQINLRAHPQYRATNLYNIDANAQAAAEVSNGWTNPRPWSTYLSGAYLRYLHGGGAPVGGTAPAPPPPPLVLGPIESVVDRVVSYIPDVPLIGGAVRNAVRSFLHPFAQAIDDALHLILGALGAARDWIAHAVANIGAIVQPWIDEAFNALNGILRGLINVVDAAWRAGVAFTAGILRDAIDAVDAAWRAGVSFASAVLRDAINAVDAAWRAALNFGVSALRTLIDGVDAAWRAALAFGTAALRTLIDAVDAAWRIGVQAAESVLRGLIDLARAELHAAIDIVDAAWRAFVHDVFDPLYAEARHWFDDVLGPIEPLLHALEQLGEWIAAAAHVAIAGPLDVAETIHGIGTDDIVQGAKQAVAAWTA